MTEIQFPWHNWQNQSSHHRMESKNFIPKCTGHTNQVVLTNHSIILDVIRPNSKTLLSTNRCWTQTLFLGLPLTPIQRITSTSMHGNLLANQMEAWNSKMAKSRKSQYPLNWFNGQSSALMLPACHNKDIDIVPSFLFQLKRTLPTHLLR